MALVHESVRRERRVHAACRAGIGADRLRAPAHDALGDQIMDRFRRRAGRVRPLVIDVEEFGFTVVALVPVGAHQHPGVGRDVAVRLLPGLHAVDGEQKIVVLRGFGRAIDDTGRPDEILGRNGVGGVVRMVLAADPVHRRVEMRAGMLAELQPIPRPERPVLVVMRDRMNLDRRRVLADLRRQLDQRRVGPERRGKVHHFDGAGSKRRRELSEKLRAVHIAHLRWSRRFLVRNGDRTETTSRKAQQGEHRAPRRPAEFI